MTNQGKEPVMNMNMDYEPFDRYAVCERALFRAKAQEATSWARHTIAVARRDAADAGSDTGEQAEAKGFYDASFEIWTMDHKHLIIAEQAFEDASKDMPDTSG